jgi:cellulose synthase/poly-beta-1,6-N-acetylglucosamine synthase-like glycosyltransferase
MLSVSALLHTKNDALRLGRCLETVYPCDEIVVFDHGSSDETLHVAREFGAKIICLDDYAESRNAAPSMPSQSLISTGWLLCLDPRESLSEALAASLFEWKLNGPGETNETAYAMVLREENAHGWIDDPMPQIRLVSTDWDRWSGGFPINQSSSTTLEGSLLRFCFP